MIYTQLDNVKGLNYMENILLACSVKHNTQYM